MFSTVVFGGLIFYGHSGADAGCIGRFDSVLVVRGLPRRTCIYVRPINYRGMSDRTQHGAPANAAGGSAQSSGSEARDYNVAAVRAVSESIRSTLGPKGMDKLITDSLGNVTATNDGVTILEEVDIDNPAANMVVETAQIQAGEAGDGTTTAVAVAGELLDNALALIERDVHPSTVMRGYDLAAARTREVLRDISEGIDAEDRDRLRSVAETAMTGKGAGRWRESLAETVVEAVEHALVETGSGDPVPDLGRIEVEPRTGGTVAESELVAGAVIEKDPVHADMPEDVPDANVLLLVEDVDVQEGDVDTTLSVESPDGRSEFLDRRDAELRHKVRQVVDTGADVVLNQKGIEDDVHHVLAEEGLLAVRRVTKDEMTFLGTVFDADLVSDLDDATPADVGHASVSRGPNDECFYVRGLEGSSGATILLRGSTQHVVEELERSVEDALDAVVTALSDGRVVAGGGATEAEVAGRIREYAGSVSGREQLAVESYADAVELVPRTLAESAGLDRVDVMTELRVAHADGDSHAGLNVHSGDVEDTFDAGVVEPARGKEQALTSATEAANAILKIDGIITVSEENDIEEKIAEATGDEDEEA